MPKLNSFIAHTATYSLMGLMWHTNTVFDKINQDLQHSAIATHSKLLTLKDCMKKIQDWCAHCDKKLTNMKEALRYAKEAQSFAQIDIVEMREVCQDLHNTFQLLAEANERGYVQVNEFNKSIVSIAKWLEINYVIYKRKCWGLGFSMGTILTLSVADNILLAALGGFFGTCMVQLGMRCASYTKGRTDIQLIRVSVDTNTINNIADSSRTFMSAIVVRLQDQFELACKNNGTKAESGIKVRKQVDKMMADISLLRNKLYEVNLKSRVNEKNIDKSMNLTSIIDPLKL